MDSFVLHRSDPGYPSRLRACADAPDILYGIGALDANRGHFVSVVGTRRATERARALTTTFVRSLAAAIPDLTIVSGLAYGIDVAAHRAALDCGIPTIIVPGHGLDRIYPSVHRPVAVAALSRGGILTEYPEGTEIYGSNFLRRNRIIAGLSDCTVVVESGARGGSLCTARLAHRYGRPVFTFPGRPSDESSEGCNALIRDHIASLILNASDLIHAMHWHDSRQLSLDLDLANPDSPQGTEPDTPLGEAILAYLKRADNPAHINDIVHATHADYATVATELMMLEVDSLISALPGGLFMAQNNGKN